MWPAVASTVPHSGSISPTNIRSTLDSMKWFFVVSMFRGQHKYHWDQSTQLTAIGLDPITWCQTRLEVGAILGGHSDDSLLGNCFVRYSSSHLNLESVRPKWIERFGSDSDSDFTPYLPRMRCLSLFSCLCRLDDKIDEQVITSRIIPHTYIWIPARGYVFISPIPTFLLHPDWDPLPSWSLSPAEYCEQI